jgi:hypothetical protein
MIIREIQVIMLEQKEIAGDGVQNETGENAPNDDSFRTISSGKIFSGRTS